MEFISTVSESVSAAYTSLMRNYYLMLIMLVLTLVFALYVYFFPTSIDFFANPEPADKRLRSEPPA
jgi:hypothetical protein